MQNVQEMPEMASKIGNKLYELAQEATMQAHMMVKNPSAALFVSSMATLGAAVTSAAMIAKRPDGVSHESSVAEQKAAVAKMVNRETVLFSMLVAARMFQNSRADDDSTFTHSEYSPDMIHEAIEDWKKLTGKDPADYLFGPLVEADKNISLNSDKPMLDFLGSRKSQFVSGSGTVQ